MSHLYPPELLIRRFLAWAGVAAMAIAMALSVPSTKGHAIDWQLNQTATAQITFSDNVDLDPDAQAESAITPSASYSISGTGRGGRVLFSTSSRLRLSADSNDEELDVDQAIRLFGRAELWRDRFFLDGSVSSTQELISVSGRTTANNNNNSDQDTVTSISISPIYQERFGQWADSQLSYRHTEIFTSGNSSEDARADALQLTVSGGQRLKVFQPSFTAGWFRFDEDENGGNSDDIEQFSVQFSSTYQFTRKYGAIATVGYDNVTTPGSTRELGGFFWSAGVTMTPGPRTQLSLQVGRRYDSFGIVGSGSYQITPRLRLSLSATQDVGTGLQRAGTQVQRISVANQQGGLSGPNGLPPGFLRSDLDNGISINQIISFGVTGTYGRNTVNFGGTNERRDFDQGTENLRQLRLTVSRDFSRRVTGSVNMFYRYVDERTGADTHAVGGRATVNYRLGSRTTVFAGVSRTDRFSADATEEFTENTVFFGGSLRF